MSKQIDLLGQRFGRWLVIALAPPGRAGARWLCLCDCGAERPVLSQELRKGASLSCGCSGRESQQIVGQRFGRLVVVAEAPSKLRADGYGKRAQWMCRCDCGTTKVVPANHLRRGDTRSCGCMSRENGRALLKLFRHLGQAASVKRNVAGARARAAETWARGLKRCASCRQEWALSDFNRSTLSPDGLSPSCRPCGLPASRAYTLRQVMGPSDSYVARLLGRPVAELVPELIEAKRKHLRLVRLVKERTK